MCRGWTAGQEQHVRVQSIALRGRIDQPIGGQRSIERGVLQRHRSTRLRNSARRRLHRKGQRQVLVRPPSGKDETGGADVPTISVKMIDDFYTRVTALIPDRPPQTPARAKGCSRPPFVQGQINIRAELKAPDRCPNERTLQTILADQTAASSINVYRPCSLHWRRKSLVASVADVSSPVLRTIAPKVDGEGFCLIMDLKKRGPKVCNLIFIHH